MDKNFISSGVIEKINQRLDNIEGKIDEVKSQVSENADASKVDEIKSELKDSIIDLKGDIKSELSNLQSTVNDINTRLGNIEGIDTITD